MKSGSWFTRLVGAATVVAVAGVFVGNGNSSETSKHQFAKPAHPGSVSPQKAIHRSNTKKQFHLAADAKPVRKTLADFLKEQEAAGQEPAHPLEACVKWAKESHKEAQLVKDYVCVFIKRERIDGELRDFEYMQMKIRHEPFSVYTNFLKPKELKGQEAIYVEGKYDGKIVAHPTGLKQKIIGRVQLLPTSTLAMNGNRYPITEAGILNLTSRLIEVGMRDLKHQECEVKYTENAKVQGRLCTRVEVIHPVPRKHFEFHRARIYVDNELNLPIRYEAYDWPRNPGEEPLLTEEYTYIKLQLNVELTDDDFNPDNRNYNYGR